VSAATRAVPRVRIDDVLTADEGELLARVLGILSESDAHPVGSSAAEQDAWMGREEAESALAGRISTALAHGRTDRQQLSEARALVNRWGTRADAHDVRVALYVLGNAG